MGIKFYVSLKSGNWEYNYFEGATMIPVYEIDLKNHEFLVFLSGEFRKLDWKICEPTSKLQEVLK